jgi:hypothetical protein
MYFINISGVSMSDTQTDVNGKNTLEDLQQEIRQRAEREFTQGVLSAELVNRLSLKFISKGMDKSDLTDWLNQQYPLEVELCFSELYNYCYHYALKLLSKPEQAEDIAQDTIKELLSTRNSVGNLKAWLCRVTHNKAMAALKKQNHDNDLKNLVQLQLVEKPLHPDEDDLSRKLSPISIRKLLSKRDYKTFCDLKDSPNLKEYAKRTGISYQTAKEHNHRIKVNLRSAYLREQGWRDSQAILSFQQLRSLKRFMDRLTTLGNPENQKLCTKNCDLQETFKDCTGIMTWDISLKDDNSFKLIVMISTTALPTAVSMTIKLNRSNRIRILSCKRGNLVATMPMGDFKPLLEVKGKTRLNYNDLLQMIPSATVYDQENFTNMVERWKNRE